MSSGMLSVSTDVAGGRGCPRSQNEECRLLVKPIQQSKGLPFGVNPCRVLLTMEIRRDA